MRIAYSVLFVLLSAVGGLAFSADYYPASDVVETTDPAAAQAVLKQARELQEQESSAVPAKQNMNKTQHGKKKARRKAKNTTEGMPVQ